MTETNYVYFYPKNNCPNANKTSKIETGNLRHLMIVYFDDICYGEL